jgi:hypothetical protein
MEVCINVQSILTRRLSLECLRRSAAGKRARGEQSCGRGAHPRCPPRTMRPPPRRPRRPPRPPPRPPWQRRAGRPAPPRRRRAPAPPARAAPRGAWGAVRLRAGAPPNQTRSRPRAPRRPPARPARARPPARLRACGGIAVVGGSAALPVGLFVSPAAAGMRAQARARTAKKGGGGGVRACVRAPSPRAPGAPRPALLSSSAAASAESLILSQTRLRARREGGRAAGGVSGSELSSRRARASPVPARQLAGELEHTRMRRDRPAADEGGGTAAGESGPWRAGGAACAGSGGCGARAPFWIERVCDERAVLQLCLVARSARAALLVPRAAARKPPHNPSVSCFALHTHTHHSCIHRNTERENR